jgi:hypothetical protein
MYVLSYSRYPFSGKWQQDISKTPRLDEANGPGQGGKKRNKLAAAASDDALSVFIG